MKLPLAICAALLAMTSTFVAAKQLPAPPAPPAPPAVPARPHPPELPDLPDMPELPDLPAPPAPPAPPAIEIPDDVLAACEGKADRHRIQMTASNGAYVTGTCRKHGKVYAFKLDSYRLHTATKRSRP